MVERCVSSIIAMARPASLFSICRFMMMSPDIQDAVAVHAGVSSMMQHGCASQCQHALTSICNLGTLSIEQYVARPALNPPILVFVVLNIFLQASGLRPT